MIDLFKKYVPWKWLVYIRPSFLTLVSDDLKTQEMCNEAVSIDPWLLHDFLDYLKTQEISNKAITKARWLEFDVPDRFRNLTVSIIRAIHPLRYIPPDHPKTQGVRQRVIKKDPW